jgi:lipopolysaccharide transport protein LptA
VKKIRQCLYLLCVLGVPGAGVAESLPDLRGDFEIDEALATVITSTRLTIDQKNQFALFEENVVVRDPAIRLRADRLTVFFDATNQAERIEAEGRVVIQQDRTMAWAEKATYDVVSGEIFMEGQPRIRRGQDVLEADTITFWRDDNKIICEPSARMVIFPQGEGARSVLGGR